MRSYRSRMKCAFLPAALLLAAATAAEAKDPFSLADLFRVRGVGSVAISPGGRYVAYVVTEPADTLGGQEYDNPDIWVVDLEDRDHPRQFAFGDSKEISPKWSYDDRYLYFLSDRGDGGKMQVWRIAVAGGEAERVTSLEGGAVFYAPGPHGGRLAVTGACSRTQEEIDDCEAGRDWKRIGVDKVRNRLWVVDPETGAEDVITPRDMHISSACWSPDGGRLAVLASADAGSNSTYFNSRIEVIDLGDRVMTLVSEDAGGPPSWSPDGSRLTFSYRARVEGVTLPADVLAVVSPDGSGLELLGERHGGTLVGPVWMPGENKLLVINLNGVRAELATVSIADSKVERIEQLDIPYYLRGLFDVSRDGSRIAFLKGGAKSPPEVWVWERGLFSGSERLTDTNRWIEERTLPEAKVVRWKSRDGTSIEGVIWLPEGFKKDGTWPAVIVVHGGPMWAWWYGWHGNWHDWAIPLASRGFVVLLPNPRGSLGYGPGFARANFDDWGGGDYEDMIAGADFLVEEKYASRDKLGIAGWSYGGYMTSRVVTRTARFAAAVAGAAVTNLFSFHGTTDITPDFLEEYFRETAYSRPEAYRSHSPMEGVGGAKTPTLILHGEDDYRVPVGQGYELYNGLSQSGVECEMVVYPREGHSFREIRHRIDVIERLVGWFETRLK